MDGLDFFRKGDEKPVKGLITKPEGFGSSPLLTDLRKGNRGHGFEIVSAKYLVDNGVVDKNRVIEFGRRFDTEYTTTDGIIKKTTVEADMLVESEDGYIFFDMKNKTVTKLDDRQLEGLKTLLIDPAHKVTRVRFAKGSGGNDISSAYKEKIRQLDEDINRAQGTEGVEYIKIIDGGPE